MTEDQARNRYFAMVFAQMIAVAGAVFDLVDWEVPVQSAAEIIARFALSPDEYLEAKNRVDEIVLRYRIDVVAEQYVQLFAAERNSERIGRREI